MSVHQSCDSSDDQLLQLPSRFDMQVAIGNVTEYWVWRCGGRNSIMQSQECCKNQLSRLPLRCWEIYVDCLERLAEYRSRSRPNLQKFKSASQSSSTLFLSFPSSKAHIFRYRLSHNALERAFLSSTHAVRTLAKIAIDFCQNLVARQQLLAWRHWSNRKNRVQSSHTCIHSVTWHCMYIHISSISSRWGDLRFRILNMR